MNKSVFVLDSSGRPVKDLNAYLIDCIKSKYQTCPVCGLKVVNIGPHIKKYHEDQQDKYRVYKQPCRVPNCRGLYTNLANHVLQKHAHLIPFNLLEPMKIEKHKPSNSMEYMNMYKYRRWAKNLPIIAKEEYIKTLQNNYPLTLDFAKLAENPS